MSSSPRAQHNSSTGHLLYGTLNGRYGPKSWWRGSSNFSLLYNGCARLVWGHVLHGGTLQPGPSSPSVQKAIHLQTIFRDGFNGFMRAAESFVHNKEEWSWPWLPGAEIILAVPENSNRAVLHWRNWTPAPSWILDSHNDLHQQRPKFLVFIFYTVHIL